MTQALAVVGPTASGKTALAIALAERLDTEIISADSMQFYRGMTIGTAAPSLEEQSRVKHHFVGFLNPGDPFSAGAYERAAREVAADLNARGKLAVVTGGSGLYIRAFIDGLFPGPGRDESIRQRLHAEAEERGVPALFDRLRAADPSYASIINPNDLRRIVRGLEVFEITQRPLSELHREHRAASSSLDAVQVALDYPRELLYARINARTDRMIEQGLLDEVRRLLEQGYGGHIERLRSLGYGEMAACLRGECSLEEATELMKRNTRRFAKRQLTWFRADPRIHWLPVIGGESEERRVETILDLLA